MSPDQKAQYDRLLPEDRDEIRNWLLQQLHPNSLVYEILAWLDENVGLRLDQNTIRELLDQNRDELRQLIAQRLAN